MLDGVSIIIPTYNRSILLDKTLHSLSHQLTQGLFSFEVIVVDDGSKDNTREVVFAYKNKLNIKYIFQEDNGFRVALARNKGIKLAEFGLCLFLDSGVIAHPELLIRHYQYHNRVENLVLIGSAYGMQEFEASDRAMPHDFTDLDSHFRLFEALSSRSEFYDSRDRSLSQHNLSFNNVKLPWLLCWTCHLSVPKAALEALHGFDEQFISWGGEDVELGIRLFKLGCQFEYLQPAMAIHAPHDRSATDNQRSSRQNCLYIFNKHPSKATYLLSHGQMGWESVLFRCQTSPPQEHSEAYV